MVRAVLAAIVLALLTLARPAHAGPCDLGATCAEAWSVSYGLYSSYNGNLFQIALISSPSTTMNVGQTTQRTADLTGVLSFCGGTYSNCAVSKIYAQVQGSSNDLVPSVFAATFGPNCSAGGLTCACPLTIDATTGFPTLPLDNGTNCEYTLASDNTATGVTGGSSSSTSLILVAQTVGVAGSCCGTFNIAHAWNGADTHGTDLGIQLVYSNTGSFVNCTDAKVYCLGVDLESNTTPNGTDLSSIPIYVEAYLAWDEPNNLLDGAINNQQAWTPVTPFASMNPGTHVHMGGGGDLSQPAASNSFEWMIFNSLLTSTQQTAIYNNVTQRYTKGFTQGSTWDATRASADTDLTFSNGNLTVKETAGNGSDHPVFGTRFQSAGKYVFKVTVNSITNSGGAGSEAIGLATAATSSAINAYIGETTTSFGWIGSGTFAGQVHLNGGSLATIDTFQTGDVLYLAVDFANKKFWGLNATHGSGLWNGTTTTANVDAGSGGIDISGLASLTLSPATDLNQLNDQVTFGGTAAGSPLTTFSSWDLAPSVAASRMLLGYGR